ncbi:DnaJ_domain-containing protein [Hexamita inflata]|uniref:DnaJ domain-containing protein n=1 Tax=Hexamita inflata TaxID=28002 RepID=A0AA86QE29_9EUKA|nr:DnaJ domain-containing protein [Hexamita inflata]
MSAFSILNVPEDCDSDAEIKKAYRQLALQFHPDRVTEENREGSEDKMKAINDAYSLIRDQDSRNSYRASQKMFATDKEATIDVPNYVYKKQYDFERDRSKLWASFITGRKAKWSDFLLKNIQFGECFPGKLRLFSQNIFVEFVLTFRGGNIEPVRSRREFIVNQLLRPSESDFKCPSELFNRLKQEMNNYEPQIDFANLKTKIVPTEIASNVEQQDLCDNQFGMQKQINKAMKSMFFEILKETFRSMKSIDNKETQVEDIVPDIQMGVCESHPLSNKKGTIIVEMDAVMCKYTSNGSEKVALFNLAVGDSFGEAERGWIWKKLYGDDIKSLK